MSDVKQTVDSKRLTSINERMLDENIAQKRAIRLDAERVIQEYEENLLNELSNLVGENERSL